MTEPMTVTCLSHARIQDAHETMKMNADSRISAASGLRRPRLSRTLLVCALAAAPFFAPAASAAPGVANQAMPGLADTPGSQNAAVSKPLAAITFKTESGKAVLDSGVLLKVYFYAYAGIPVDYSDVLTENTDNIVPPVPVKPSAADRAAIDRLVAQAKAHPDLLIKVDDIALNAYDKTSRSFEVVNRLFVDGGRFYFENSPFHYAYSNPAQYRTLPCTDTRTVAAIDSAVANYQHFSLAISAHVAQTNAKDKSLILALGAVTLKDELGSPLITLSKSAQP
jgi:hypothetical protein